MTILPRKERNQELFRPIVVAIFLGACASREQAFVPPLPPEPKMILPGAMAIQNGSMLDADELISVKAKAEAGDRDAALRLSIHFNSAGDMQESSRWQKIAAERGNTVAQYNMWADNRGSVDCASMRESLVWLEAAAQGGSKLAAEELDTYKRLVEKKCRHR